MFTVCARVVIRIKHSLQDVSNEDCHQFMVSLILPVFATVFTSFSTVPAKIVFAMQKPNSGWYGVLGLDNTDHPMIVNCQGKQSCWLIRQYYRPLKYLVFKAWTNVL